MRKCISVVAGTPRVELPSAVRKIGFPFCSALKMMALRLSRFLMLERMDDIAAVVAFCPSDAGAHATDGALIVAPDAEAHPAVASTPANAKAETPIGSKLRVAGNRTSLV
jgi:hypothetical protein